MKISTEAIDAAAKAIMPAAWDEAAYWPGDTRERFQGLARTDARAALDAALPYLTEPARHQPITDWPDIPRSNK